MHSNAGVAGIAIKFAFLGPNRGNGKFDLNRNSTEEPGSIGSYWIASSSEARVRRRHDVHEVVVEICDCVSVHVVEHPDQSHQRSKVCAMGKVGCRRTVVDDDLDRG